MIEFISIPSSEFVMGISPEQAENVVQTFFPPEGDINPYLFYTEVPQHKTKVKEFHISKHETTNREFKEFVDAGGYEKKELWIELMAISTLNTDLEGEHRIELFKDQTNQHGPANWANGTFPADQPNHPVECISWFEAQAYCRWKTFRLPTEPEWEYAARGHDQREFPWSGDKKIIHQWRTVSTRQPSEVASNNDDRSIFGVMDLGGNVSEWIADAWHPYPNSPIGQLKKIDEAYGVVRGGNYLAVAAQYRATYRQRKPRLLRSVGVGFRCSK
jgi:gamma-glutamyl hercynylcysteine S-oxide synthase